MEFGSAGNLIATAICDFECNGQKYKAGDIVLNLNDVSMHFNYGTTTSDAKSSRTQLYYNEYYLDNFIIEMAPFNLQTQKLFANLTSDKITVIETEQSMAMMGRLLLSKTLKNDGYIKIENIENFDIDTQNDITIISSVDFQDNKYYNIVYETEMDCNTIELDNAALEIPYLKVQINFKGNIDKLPMSNYFFIDKAAVRLTPLFSLQGNTVSHIKLLFKVIYGDSKPKMSVVANG
jgi:hypothetical protein